MKKVAMIGVGKLGQDCAEVMAGHYDVVGYDVVYRSPAFPMCNTIEEAVKDRDFIFIAAPTPHDPIYGGETPTSQLPNKDFDYAIVTDILKEVNKYVNNNQLVVLISTTLPGTVRNILAPCITNARFIYNPYLIAMGTIKWDMVNPEMVIIGTEDGDITGDAHELIDFYKLFRQNNPRYEVGTWDEAESIKIFYNTFISTKVALVNMIQDVAETNGNVNVDVVTQALAKSTTRIMGPAYMTAGMGDGGACHPRDNIALRYLAERLDLGYDLFDSINNDSKQKSHPYVKDQIGWARLEIDPSNNFVLVDEIQSDHNNAAYKLRSGNDVELKNIKIALKNKYSLDDTALQKLLSDYSAILKDFTNIATETVAKFARKNNIKKIYWHTFEGGKSLKNNVPPLPPKSIYTTTPQEHFYEPSDDKPFGLDAEFFEREAQRAHSLVKLARRIYLKSMGHRRI